MEWGWCITLLFLCNVTDLLPRFGNAASSDTQWMCVFGWTTWQRTCANCWAAFYHITTTVSIPLFCFGPGPGHMFDAWTPWPSGCGKIDEWKIVDSPRSSLVDLRQTPFSHGVVAGPSSVLNSPNIYLYWYFFDLTRNMNFFISRLKKTRRLKQCCVYENG